MNDRPIIVSQAAAELLEELERRLPDIPAGDSPPGKTIAQMTRRQHELALTAIEGFKNQAQHALMTQRNGTRGAHDLACLIGELSVIAAQLRRHLAADQAA